MNSLPQNEPDGDAAITRRALLRYGATGIACASGAGALLWYFYRESMNAMPAEIFTGDCPSGATWDQWVRRGWVKEATHYLKVARNVQCKICPNNCVLKPDDRSHCRNKVNRDGVLYTLAYGNPCTFHVDPVEKKPLFHFLPGTKAFSLATSGCVFRCLNCQNWEISQKKPEETKDAAGQPLALCVPLPQTLSNDDLRRLSLFPRDLPGVARALGCPSIAYTYSEPTAYYEYTNDCCKAARDAGIRNIVVTCGSIEERPLRDLARNVDAAHVDLKGFSEEVYRKLNSGRLRTILNTLKLYQELGVWFEVINLIVPTYTDDLDAIKRMCGWIADNLGPDRPLHFSRFHPLHRLTHLPPTPSDVLRKAREIARNAGLHYVYIGNAPEIDDAAFTWCPGCKRNIVERDVFAVTRCDVVNGRCRFCQTPIAGYWG